MSTSWPDDQITPVARYLAVGDAHVIVTPGGNESCTHGALHERAFSVTCEGCGHIYSGCVSFTFDNEDAVVKEALDIAQEHAETCRRVPERLWPENAGDAR